MCSLTTRPKNVTTFFESNCDSDMLVRSCIREIVYFHCRTDKQTPVDWRFSGDEDCIYCSGFLSYKYIGHYSVNASVSGEYTLRVDNITQNDAGVYTCIDDAGFGPDVASAVLTIIGKHDELIILAESPP